MGGFGVQWSTRAAGHLGPIREEMGVGWRGWKCEKEDQKKRRQMGEKEQGRVWDKVIKGEEDKANWAGRSDNSFVMKP